MAADPLRMTQVSVQLNLQLDVRQSESMAKEGEHKDRFFESVQLRIWLHSRDDSDSPRWLVDLEKTKATGKFTAEEVAGELANQIHLADQYLICSADDFKDFAKAAAAEANKVLAGISAAPLGEGLNRAKISRAVAQLLA